MSVLISAEDAFRMAKERGKVCFVDCRFSLEAEDWGKTEYLKEHIPGAVYLHLEKDLSGPVEEHGGRHPLPNLEQFRGKIETLGISNDAVIIVYDQGEAPYAARFLWLMKYVGHERIYVLNGGFSAWKRIGLPVTTDIPEPRRLKYNLSVRPQLLADTEEVRKVVAGEKRAILIDSREEKRFLGEYEPIDKKAGRIPGAIHKWWMEGMEKGFFLPAEAQRKRFEDVPKDSEIIVYCGSGVTAAPNVLALANIGFDKVKLYVGSFSDWISYDEYPVEIGPSREYRKKDSGQSS